MARPFFPLLATLPNTIGADLIRAVAAESNKELASGRAEDFAQMSGAPRDSSTNAQL